MTAFPSPRRGAQPYPRNRMVPGRVPPMNAMARGFGAGRFGQMAQQPQPFPRPQPRPGGRGGGGRPGGYIGPPIHPGPPPPAPGLIGPPEVVPGAQPPPHWTPGSVDPNQFLDPSYTGPRDPLSHLNWWGNHGWDLNNQGTAFRFGGIPANLTNPGGNPYQHGGGPGGQGPGGGGGGVGPAGGGQGGGWRGWGGGGGDQSGPPAMQNPNVPGLMNDQQIHDLRRQFGLPLDPQYEATRRALTDQLNASLASALAAYTQGQGSLGLQNQLSTDQANNDLAARGVYGSGLQNRSDRLLGDQYAGGLLGLNQDYYGAQSQAGLGFNQGLMEAMLALARRQASTPRNNAPRGGR